MKRMAIELEIEVDVPEDATLEDIEEWLCFAVGHRGGISGANPLSAYDLDAKRFFIRSVLSR